MALWDDFEQPLKIAVDDFRLNRFVKYADFISYSPDFDAIRASFDSSLEMMRPLITSNPPRLDRHKLVSAVVRGILANPIFSFDRDKVQATDDIELFPIMLRFPNEFFSFLFIRSSLTEFNKAVKEKLWEDTTYDFDYPQYLYNINHPNDDPNVANRRSGNFATEMVKLLHHLGEQTKEQKKMHGTDQFPLLVFAHLLLMTEIANDCGRHNYAGKYYNITEG